MEVGKTVKKTEWIPSPYRRLMAKTGASIDTDSNWLITLSDLLTLLLVFFVFALTAGNLTAQKTPEQKNAAIQPSDHNKSARPAAYEEPGYGMSSIIEDLKMQEGVSVRTVKGEVIITLKEKVTFSPGEADILHSFEPILDKIGGMIRNHPQFQVEIDGHTDNQPISTPLYPSNWELSVDRATKVLKYFIKKQGINPARFYVKGNAELRPLLPNDTPESRAENRRVEIRLKP
jgi:chemotaxis protein MotB